jgi:hypothetical protein
VENEVTGLVADDLEDYSRCVDRLKNDEDLRRNLSKSASTNAKKRFGIENTISSFDSIYAELMECPKITRSLTESGKQLSPDRIFLLSQGSVVSSIYLGMEEGNAIYGSNKVDVKALPALSWSPTRGSVYHYSFFFPENKRLARWADLLSAVDPRKSRTYDN